MEQITRQLKICYGYTGRSNVKRPYIRLCGEYLRSMHFNIGERVTVAISKDAIVITKCRQEVETEYIST